MARKKRSSRPEVISEPTDEEMRRMDAERMVSRQFKQSKVFDQQVRQIMRELGASEKDLAKRLRK